MATPRNTSVVDLLKGWPRSVQKRPNRNEVIPAASIDCATEAGRYGLARWIVRLPWLK